MALKSCNKIDTNTYEIEVTVDAQTFTDATQKTYLKQRIRFFPILWREDDQVSNVKMVNQAITVLQLLGSYVVNKKKFAEEEHRDRLVAAYEADVVTTNIKS